jgi:hypothetical protein
MGGAAMRTKLERNLNRAFSAAQIKKSANQVAKLGARADFLDISDALGCIAHIPFDNLKRYRRVLTIPHFIQRALTAAYRDALFREPKPIPLRIKIVNGRTHLLEVKTTDRQISVRLTRPDPKTEARTRK